MDHKNLQPVCALISCHNVTIPYPQTASLKVKWCMFCAALMWDPFPLGMFPSPSAYSLLDSHPALTLQIPADTLTLAPTRAHTHTLQQTWEAAMTSHHIPPQITILSQATPCLCARRQFQHFIFFGKKTKRNRHSTATPFWIYSNCHTTTILSTCWLFIICSIKHNLISRTPLIPLTSSGSD